MTTDRESEFQRLAHLDLATGTHTYLSAHIPWDVEQLRALARRRARSPSSRNEDGVSVLRLLDTATGKEKPAPKLPIGVVGGLEWHDNGRDLGFTLSSARSPADVYSLDVDDRQARALDRERDGRPERGDASRSRSSCAGRASTAGRSRASSTGPTDALPGPAAGDHQHPRRARGRSRGPASWGATTTTSNELGVAILYPNVRGSTGYGKTFLKLDNGVLREDSVKDIGALLDWIATRTDLDAARVMVTGGSYGGYMTLAVAMHYDDRIRCALDVVGISNFVTFLENTEAYRRDLRRVEYGDERDPAMRELLLEDLAR